MREWTGSRRRALIGGGAALGTAALLAACGRQAPAPAGQGSSGPTAGPAAAAGQPKRGGTLKLPIVFTSGHFDIHQFQTGYQMAVWRCCANGLFTLDPESGNPAGDLAAVWEFPDPTTLVVRLKPGAKWHAKEPVNGRALTARDVVFSLERLATRSAEFVRNSDYAFVERFDAPDPATVRISLKRPFVPLISMLANFQAVVVAPEVVDKYGDLKRAEAIVGSGPFIAERADASTGARVVRNPEYWEPGLPYLDAVEWTIINDAQTSLAAFRSGDVHLHAIEAIDLPAFAADRSIRVEKFLNPQYFVQGLGGPIDRAPLNDARVREAIDLAVDREALGKVAYPGAEFALGGVFAHPAWALPATEVTARAGFRRPKDADLTAATALVRAAGAPALTITTSPQYPSFYIDRAQVFKAQLERVGFKVELDPTEYSAFKDRERGKRFQLTTGTWAFYNDPDALLSGAFAADGARNYFSYANPRYEALLEKERAEQEATKRKETVFEAQRLLLEDRPLAAFTAWFLPVTVGVRAEVRGVRFGGNGPTGTNVGEEGYQAKTIWLDR
jgi:peptide/nickel transport system substrate-binding protein